MNTPRQELEARVARAVTSSFCPRPPAPYVRPCPDPRHGDFQTNAALVQAKTSQGNPREIAEQLRAAIDLDGIAEPRGNRRARLPQFPAHDRLPRTEQVKARWEDARLGVPSVAKPETVVVDYSSPNIAKEMHVGHLRSTILGDALARIYSFLGHSVIADNHIGDWGTGFGMILLGYKREGSAEKLQIDPFGHLEAIYRKIQDEAKTDEVGARGRQARARAAPAGRRAEPRSCGSSSCTIPSPRWRSFTSGSACSSTTRWARVSTTTCWPAW